MWMNGKDILKLRNKKDVINSVVVYSGAPKESEIASKSGEYNC